MEAYQVYEKSVHGTGKQDEWGFWASPLGNHSSKKLVILHTISINSVIVPQAELMKFFNENQDKNIYAEVNGNTSNFTLNSPSTISAPPGESKMIIQNDEPPLHVIGQTPPKMQAKEEPKVEPAPSMGDIPGPGIEDIAQPQADLNFDLGDFDYFAEGEAEA